MIQQIEEHITKVDAFTASTLDDVEKFRIEYLGKKGSLMTFLLPPKMPNNQKKVFGQKLNELKQKTSSKIEALKIEISSASPKVKSTLWT